MEDEGIICLYFDRNENAITETKNKYGRMIYSISFNIVKVPEDAEECESDTYLSCWNSIPPQRPDSFSAFLSKIVRNISINRLRRQNTAKRKGENLSFDELADCIPDSGHFDDALSEKELAEMIGSFLKGISRDDRVIFMRRYWYCDPVADIAKKLGFTESKVKMSLWRTREKLREYLKGKGVFV